MGLIKNLKEFFSKKTPKEAVHNQQSLSSANAETQRDSNEIDLELLKEDNWNKLVAKVREAEAQYDEARNSPQASPHTV